MSTKLQKQFEKTARNNPYSPNKVKGKISTEKDPAALDISKTQPQRKKSAPLATFKSCQKAPASHTNTFVPIPELGIYSPDQHVLQNGTFAQHCHNRDVNRMNCPGNLQQVDSNCSNASSNSSFDEVGSQFGNQKKGVPRGFDSQDYSHNHDSRADIYQVPSSQQHNQDIFNHQSNPSRKPVRNETLSHNYRRVTNPARSNRNVDNIKKDKLSPSARSHSLSDLSTGLTLSLIGQKKYDSVVSINGHSQLKSMASSSSSRRHTTRGPPVLQDIENRLMGTTMTCQDSVTSPASLYKNSKFQADQGKGFYNQLSSKSVMNGHPHMTHQTKQNTMLEQPYQQKLQNQQLQYFHQHKQHQQLQKDYAVCDDNHMMQQLSFPRSRKDSEGTTSSHRSAHSDVQSCEDLDAKFNNRLSTSAQTSDTCKTTNRTVNPFSCVSARNAISCLKENDVPDRAHSAVVNSHQPGHLNKEQFVVKPRRSLPNVPLNEASERIKRFTEMMKSRLSANSANKNSPVDSHSSKYTPSRMSSVGSACSQTGDSIQTPDPSDSDVFVSANTRHYQVMTDLSQRNGFLTVYKVSSKEEMSSPRKSSGYFSESDSGAKNASVSGNGRNNAEEEVGFHHLDHRINHSSIEDTNGDDFCQRNLNQGGWHGQCHGALTFGETPHAAADQSLDSGQTTETSNSYNGSILDSGYTTNNDGENDSCSRNPPRLSHHYHKNQKEYSQHADQHNEVSRNSASNDETPHCNYQHLQKHSNNLANSHNFGSVQNIYQHSRGTHIYPQSHGNTKDFNLLKSGQFIINDKHKHLESQGPVCYKKISNKNITENKKNGSISTTAARNMLPVSHLQLLDMHLSANRRSWDCANDALSSLSDGFPSNQMKRYEKAEERYRSSDVLPSSRGFTDGNYRNSHQTGRINLNEYRQQIDSKQSTKAPSENSVSDSEISQLNGLQGFTPLMSHSSHGETKPGRDLFNQHLSVYNHDHPQKSANSACAGNVQPNGHHKAPVEDYHDSRYYKLSNGSHKQQDEVQSQQVPASRVTGLAVGYPHTGGFGATEANCTFQHYSTLGPEMSLFHMTQRYDLSPVLINLPQDILLKDMVEFGEFSVEMSLAGVPAVPNSLHGKAAQIGTPGSAFTPVKNSVDRDKPLTAQLKVTCFSSVCDDIHKYTTLGRLLKGDIVLEVNGWFCLGADGACVRRFIENCTEAITFTVARLKESDDIRFKGQTAVERIKGLESEISRLDDLIQARDEKIKNLTFATGIINVKQHTGTLSEVNGKIPFEGMVIGCDEYVV
ncbi:hypothetical protein BsWGS_24993 [Bradybaena similaris]